MLTKKELDDRSRLVMDALSSAVVEDEKGVDDAMNALGAKGWDAVHGAVLAFGTAVQKVYGIEPGDGEFMGLIVEDAQTGESGSLEDVGLGPELNAAIRIFVAWGNGDDGMAAEIFYDAVKRGTGPHVATAALAWAAHLIRPELHRKRAAGS